MSTFPVDITTERLLEFWGTINAICLQEIGRTGTHTAGDPVFEIMEMMAFEGQTGEQLTAWLHEQPEAVAYRERPVNPPAPPAPRVYRGDMGVFIDGAPDVGAGGAANLVLSFMYPRYPAAFRATIRQVWKQRQSLDVLLSWQDDAAYGLGLPQILAIRQELCAEGFRPCEWMASKVYMPADNAAATLQIMEPTLAAFLDADCISRYCVGGELDLWNSYAAIQAMINAMAPRIVARGRTLAVHFSTNRADWRPDHPGSTFAEFWNPNQGKLSSLWFQSDSEASDANLQAEMIPILERFAGNAGVVPDSGFGHPFDCYAVETSLQKMFDGGMNQAECDRRSRVLLATPAQGGPAGMVSVMGSGNGQ